MANLATKDESNGKYQTILANPTKAPPPDAIGSQTLFQVNSVAGVSTGMIVRSPNGKGGSSDVAIGDVMTPAQFNSKGLKNDTGKVQLAPESTTSLYAVKSSRGGVFIVQPDTQTVLQSSGHNASVHVGSLVNGAYHWSDMVIPADVVARASSGAVQQWLEKVAGAPIK